MSPSVDRFFLDADDPAHPLHEAFACLLTKGQDDYYDKKLRLKTVTA